MASERINTKKIIFETLQRTSEKKIRSNISLWKLKKKNCTEIQK